MNKQFKNRILLALFVITMAVGMGACGFAQSMQEDVQTSAGKGAWEKTVEEVSVFSADTLADIPDFAGNPYLIINDNMPCFEESLDTTESFEFYSELDELGRCGTAFANVGRDLMPTEKRGDIGKIRPSGWQLVKYDFVDGNYLYNRCHLIGYQLTGENANEQNLITGTRYMNVQGMLPFENRVADYVKETDGHVLYRVTPLYEGDNPVADGVQMEAWSVEDGGTGVCFNVFVYNVQPGVVIDYATGESRLAEPGEEMWKDTDGEWNYADGGTANGHWADNLQNGEWKTQTQPGQEKDYVLNDNTMKFHYPDCSSVQEIKEKNKREVTADRNRLLEQGYLPCKNCSP